jgi:hypothetical protein
MTRTFVYEACTTPDRLREMRDALQRWGVVPDLKLTPMVKGYVHARFEFETWAEALIFLGVTWHA